MLQRKFVDAYKGMPSFINFMPTLIICSMREVGAVDS